MIQDLRSPIKYIFTFFIITTLLLTCMVHSQSDEPEFTEKEKLALEKVFTFPSSH